MRILYAGFDLHGNSNYLLEFPEFLSEVKTELKVIKAV